ncbi:hypothetical protein FB451DRAFT_107601 [Mycena latifolia]|nr:hypothetical protein FB451DRAFT_107601 [Mycena latifolia]
MLWTRYNRLSDSMKCPWTLSSLSCIRTLIRRLIVPKGTAAAVSQQLSPIHFGFYDQPRLHTRYFLAMLESRYSSQDYAFEKKAALVSAAGLRPTAQTLALRRAELELFFSGRTGRGRYHKQLNCQTIVELISGTLRRPKRSRAPPSISGGARQDPW